MAEGDITDESGNLLGGKRAAMQFAHNKVRLAHQFRQSCRSRMIRRRASMVLFRIDNQEYCMVPPPPPENYIFTTLVVRRYLS